MTDVYKTISLMLKDLRFSEEVSLWNQGAIMANHCRIKQYKLEIVFHVQFMTTYGWPPVSVL